MPRRPQEEPVSHLPATFGRERNDHPLLEQVALLIKTFPPQGFSAEWHWLQARAAEDSRIVLIAESLPREELLALYGCCDVFLSLHRSEGFGRGMAEALQLGVDVIATEFGGIRISAAGRWRIPCAGGRLRFPGARIPTSMANAGRNRIWSMGGAVPAGGGAASEPGYPRISGCGRSQP